MSEIIMTLNGLSHSIVNNFNVLDDCVFRNCTFSSFDLYNFVLFQLIILVLDQAACFTIL